MSANVTTAIDDLIEYPESDGQPLAENTKQLRWIVVFYGNLCGFFRTDGNVFVAADLFWYPVQGRPEIRTAPDTLVVFGRPKGDRPSYKQWLEGNVPLTVAFEVLSPGNTKAEMDRKLLFYDKYGVDEYYVYDPDNDHLSVYLRRGQTLQQVQIGTTFVSPRLGIRFDLSGPEMVVYRPDNRRFLTFEELEDAREEALMHAVVAAQRADQAAQRADQAAQRADQAAQRADQAEQRADQAEQRANQAEQRAARLAELSRKVRRGLATEDDIRELEQLEDAP